MGKIGSPWLRGTTGKLAGMVLQGGVTRGETTIRERVVPRDPNTEAQRIQRVIMATAGVAYNKMKAIVDHSFEGYSGAAANMNRFRSLNANMLRQMVATKINDAIKLSDIYSFTPKGSNLLALNPYILSEGSLPSLSYTIDSSVPELVATGLRTSTESPASYDQVVSALGLQKGDQLTFVAMESLMKPNSDTFIYARVILEPADGDMSKSFITAQQKINDPNARNEGSDRWLFGIATDKITAVPETIRLASGFAVIVSRKVNNKWLRSPQVMFTSEIRASEIDYLEYNLEDAIALQSSYIDVPSTYYLNNAVQAG